MKRGLHRKCPTEGEILDYLGGELRASAAAEIEHHLTICPDCALRADELTEDLADFNQAAEHAYPLPPLRLAAARVKLQRHQEAYEASRAESPALSRFGWGWPRLGLAAACVAVLVAGVGALLWNGEPALAGADVLARARDVSQPPSVRPSMARYGVEFAQLAPEPEVRRQQLVVWADPRTGGYASRLEELDGTLRHAVWHPEDDGPAFAYDAATAEELIRVRHAGTAGQVTLLAALEAGFDCERLVRGFVRWLEGRDWQPVRVAHDFAVLASGEMALRLERSGDLLLVSASRETGDLQAEFTLAVSAESFEPYSLRIRFAGPQGAARITLVQQEARFVAAAHLDASVFEPSLPRPRSPQTVPRPSATAPGRALDAQTVEARLRYALHRADACWAEPVAVAVEPNGRFALRGIVGAAETKARLLAELARLELTELVSVEVATRAEALASGLRRGRADLTAAPAIASPPLAPGALPAREVLLHSDLAVHFGESLAVGPDGSVAEAITQFTAETVDRAEDLLESGWPLRRLAERYGAESNADLPAEAQAVIREMKREHVAAFLDASRRSAESMLPVLEGIAESRGIAMATVPSAAPLSPAGSWADAFLGLFGTAERIHGDALALVTVRLNVGPTSAAQSLPRPADVDRILRRLIAGIHRLEREAISAADLEAALPQLGSAPVLGQPTQKGE